MEYMSLPLETKAAEREGGFSGYAAVYGNVDLGGDIIAPGAFKEFASNDDGRITVLWQHRADQPIGTARVKSDKAGLAFDADLVMADPLAQVARAHMEAKSVRGMSIGYDVLPGGAEVMKSGVRKLTALKLWEISLVTFPMNPAAGVASVKGIRTVREFEEFLRGAGFSKSQATLIASEGFRPMGRRESGSVAQGLGSIFSDSPPVVVRPR